MIIRNGWNTNTISFALNFAVSPSKAAQAILMNANQGLFAIIKIESGSQTVKIISNNGSMTVSVSVAGTETATTCTLTTSSTMWGVSTVIVFHN